MKKKTSFRLSPDSVWMVVALAALIAAGPMATDMYLPSLPVMVQEFSTDVSTVQLTLSVYMVGFAVGQLFFGPLSDRVGRKPVIIMGLVIYILAALGCALSENIESLIAVRALQAIGACACTVMARTVVRDLMDLEQAARTQSFMSMIMALTPMFAPTLGGVFQIYYGWQATFIFLCGFAGLILMVYMFAFEESNRHKNKDALHPRAVLGHFTVFIRHRIFLGNVLTNALCFGGLFAFLSGSSFVFAEFYGIKEDRFGYYFGLIGVGFMGGTFVSGMLNKHLGPRRIMRVGARLMAFVAPSLGIFALLGIDTVFAFVIPMMLYVVCMGLIVPNSIAGAIHPFPKNAGAASSLAGFLQISAGALTGMISAWIFDGTQLPLTLFISGLGFSTWIIWRLTLARDLVAEGY